MIVRDPADAFLRQGDLCVVRSFPAWSLPTSPVQMTPDGKVTNIVVDNFERCLEFDGGLLVAICNQCCDLENPRNRSGVLVAPTRKVQAGPHETERIEEFRRCGVRVPGKGYAHQHLFPLEAPDDSELPELIIVDFSLMTATHQAERSQLSLIEARRFGLVESERTEFREKLAAFVGRPPA